MLSKSTALDKRSADSIAPAGPLPFLLGMGIGYSLFYAFLSVKEELWGAGLIFGIILMLVLMHRLGMNFEFSEARLIKNRKEFNPHISFTAKWTSVFFLIAWVLISHFLQVQYLFGLLAVFISTGVYLAVQFGFNRLFDSAAFVVTAFQPNMSFDNYTTQCRLMFNPSVIERSISVPLSPPRFYLADREAMFQPQG